VARGFPTIERMRRCRSGSGDHEEQLASVFENLKKKERGKIITGEREIRRMENQRRKFGRFVS
jgi:hypothetical protein